MLLVPRLSPNFVISFPGLPGQSLFESLYFLFYTADFYYSTVCMSCSPYNVNYTVLLLPCLKLAIQLTDLSSSAARLSHVWFRRKFPFRSWNLVKSLERCAWPQYVGRICIQSVEEEKKRLPGKTSLDKLHVNGKFRPLLLGRRRWRMEGSGMHIEEGVGPVKAEEIKVLIKDGWIFVNQRKQHH